jgi:alkylhydroperoxidase family enzyme
MAPAGGAAGASDRLERIVDSVDTPRPVPLTRPEMKRLIEDVKVRRTRIPTPELGEADRQALGDRADDYETVLRHLYTPWSARNRGPRGPRTAAQRQREQDPAMTLDYAFKTELFWIVSRVNNCQYCMGHQESKLLGAGLSEDEIAALDGDWSEHTPAERAAFAFARKLSHQPHELNDADIDALREHYTDLQILEMAMSVSRNNVSNRWKEGIGVQQRADEGGYSRVEDDPALPRGTYLTPTSEPFQNAISKVAPITFDRSGDPIQLAICRRPPLESAAEVEQALSAASRREARLPLVSEDQARSVLGDRAPEGPLPQWIRLLANFPQEGLGHITSVLDADEQGDLSPLLKAQLSWIIARQDRAWYALGQARHRLREQGQSDEQIRALDGDWQQFTPREQSLFRVARKLGASPVVITDQDVSEAVALAGPRDVVQAIHFTTMRAFFNRVTEAAGLQIEQ